MPEDWKNQLRQIKESTERELSEVRAKEEELRTKHKEDAKRIVKLIYSQLKATEEIFKEEHAGKSKQPKIEQWTAEEIQMWLPIVLEYRTIPLRIIFRLILTDRGYSVMVQKGVYNLERNERVLIPSYIPPPVGIADIQKEIKDFLEKRSQTIKMLEMGSKIAQTVTKNEAIAYNKAISNSVSLFLTRPDDHLVALFDNHGFFLSAEAETIHKRVRDDPHLYIARLASGKWPYIGVSCQKGGRWKRSHAYHLGTLAYQILGETRYDDQDHSLWIKNWFHQWNGERYLRLNAIRMKEPVVISFIHLPNSSRDDLQFLERKLEEEARISGIELLNKR